MRSMLAWRPMRASTLLSAAAVSGITHRHQPPRTRPRDPLAATSCAAPLDAPVIHRRATSAPWTERCTWRTHSLGCSQVLAPFLPSSHS